MLARGLGLEDKYFWLHIRSRLFGYKPDSSEHPDFHRDKANGRAEPDLGTTSHPFSNQKH